MKSVNPPPGYNFWQSLERMYKQVRNPVGTIVESMARFNGTYGVNLGFQRMIATQEPGFVDHVLRVNHKNYYKSKIQTDQLGRYLGKGLLTSNGEYWLRQRRLIQPGFHAEKIRALYSIIQNTVDRFLDNFPTGQQINVYPLMNKLAFRIVIDSLFNVDVPVESQLQLSSFIEEAQELVIKEVRQPYKRWWFELSGEVKRNLKNAERARNIIRGLIEQRRRSTDTHHDLLQMLMDARYEDNGEPMDERQIIDEILILLIAGHETTANALSWTLYLLANHRDELESLRAETRGFTTEQCVTNDRLNAVIKESMRLYPPAWISDRVALHDDTFENYFISKGTIVVVFYYGLHRDGKYWPEPEKFLPSRFFKNQITKEQLKAYFPFGSGPRLCIGYNFAYAEMVIFLGSFIQRFDMLPTIQKPQINPLVTLRPDRILLEIVSHRN